MNTATALSVNPIVQWAQCPSSGKVEGTASEVALSKATAPNATLIAICSYSYDIKTAATFSAVGGAAFQSLDHIADTTGNGDQWTQTFVLENAPSYSAGTLFEMLTDRCDYRVFVIAELPPGYDVLDHKSAWQQNLTGAQPLTTNSLLIGEGEVCVLASCGMQTENGAAPYLATIDGAQTLIGNWFAYDQKGGAELNLWTFEMFNNRGTYHPMFKSAAGSQKDNYITAAIAFSVPGTAPPVVVPPVATGDILTLTAAQLALLNKGISIPLTIVPPAK